MLMLLYLSIGILAGLLSGLLGIGGGSIIVPALSLVFSYSNVAPDLAMHLAAGTSLATMVITVSTSAAYYIQKRMVDWQLIKNLFPGVIVGTIAGALIAHLMHTHMLKILFGLFLLAIAFRELFARDVKGRSGLPSVMLQRFLSIGIGCISGLLGVGGGTSCLPFLLYCQVPLRKAVGVSAGVSLLAACFGTLSVMMTGLHAANLPAYSTGYIYWPAFLGIVIMSPIVAPLGAKLGQILPVSVLRRIFASLLIIIGLEMVV